MSSLGVAAGKTQIHDDQLRATMETSDEIRDLRDKDVLSDVAADQNDALRFFEVHGFGELTALPKVS